MAPTNQQARAARAKQLAGGKSPKARVQRYLKSTESKIFEGPRNVLLLKGMRCSQDMNVVLKDLRATTAPHCKLLSKNNAIVAFDTDGQQSLEFLCTKNDCSLSVVASTNKKRPNNLVIARTFDRQLLDMVELGVLRYKSLSDYSGNVPKKRIGSKPMMLFVGDLWEHDGNCSKLQNMFIDLYKGDPVNKLMISGLDHLVLFTAALGVDDKPIIHQRTYFCKLKKNPRGGNTPVPYLEPCGPDMDFEIRRTQMAAPDLWKAALKQPSAAKPSKTKNHSTNIFGETIGRLHLEKQNIEKMGGRKVKALRRAEKAQAQAEKAALESELAQEKEEIDHEFKQTYGFDEDETEKKRGF